MRLLAESNERALGDVIPMINVAFLLLIFFLVMARLAPPDPLDVEPPLAGGTAGDGDATLFVDAGGTIAFGELRGDAAVTAVAKAESPILIMADAELDASIFSQIVSRLAAEGLTELRLATVTQ